MNFRLRHYIMGILGLATLPASAQLPESALDHMLQRPIVSKRFEHKRFGDHLFLEGGVGAQALSSGRPYPGLQARAALGDWQTPEHGWRLGLSGGQLRSADEWMTTADFSADYLLNFTALCAPGRYDQPRRFEVYGVAGLDVLATSYDSQRHIGLGAHLGLHGRLALTPLTYFYVEPQLGILQDRLLLSQTFHRYRFLGSLQAGFGYRLLTAPQRSTDSFEQGRFLDNTFVTLFAGPATFLFDNELSMRQSMGARFGLGFGKFFNAYHGLRLAGSVGTMRQADASTLGFGSAQADYLLNLHALFGGERTERPFWLNAVAGAGLHATRNNGLALSASVGGGLQANFRLNDRMALYLEPRIDAYQSGFAPNVHSTGNLDVAGSLMAGLTLYRGVGSFERAADAQAFDRKPWYNNLFFEAGAGLNIVGNGTALRRPTDYLGLSGTFGAGAWFSATSGLRLWAGGGGVVPPEYATSIGYLAVGADYLWNITNTIQGYVPERRRELIASAGLTLGHTKGSAQRFSPGVKVSLRRQWNLNPMFGIYVEPELKAYGKEYYPGADYRLGVDVQGSLLAGVQLKMRTPDAATYRDEWEENNIAGYFSAAAGPAFNGITSGGSMHTGFLGRLSYTKPVSPLNAWRFNLNAYYTPGENNIGRHTTGTLGVDYVTDFTARAFGYDPSRRLNLKGFVGLNGGCDYSGSEAHPTAEASVGLQFSVRAGEKFNVFAEPQVAYSFSRAFSSSNERVRPALLVGVDYVLKRAAEREPATPRERKNEVSASFGGGLYSATVRGMEGFKKLTFASDITYARWLNATGGVRAGVSFMRGKHPETASVKLRTLHVDYMFDLRRAITGADTEGDVFHLTGLVGAGLATSKSPKADLRLAPGLQAGLQFGWKVRPEIEVFAEPTLSLYQKCIDPMPFPAEAEARLLIGTKYSF